MKSWRQQPDTPVYTKDLDGEGVRHALLRLGKTVLRNGAPPRKVLEVSQSPLEALGRIGITSDNFFF